MTDCPFGLRVVFIGILAGLASAQGCSGNGGGDPFTLPSTGPSGASTGSSGGSGGTSSSGTGDVTGSGAAGSGNGGSATTGGASVSSTSMGTGGGASSGAAGGGGASGGGAGPSTGTGGGNASGSGGTSGAGGSAGTAGWPAAGAGGQPAPDAGRTDAGADDIAKIVATTGCGKDPGQALGMAVRGTIQTMGTKAPGCADSKCGAWSYEREYFVTLPQGYERSKAYPLVFQGPACLGIGTAVYPLDANAANTVIRVGLTPPPNDIGHATNPNQGCFDDKEGDDSVDWVFYENLYDRLAGQLCFDKHRVFANGNASGAWLSNELGCKYAGDTTRPIRAVMPTNGALPNQAQYKPTCTTMPMAGMWIYEVGDQTGSTLGTTYAVQRAMTVNGCAGLNYFTAEFDEFPIGGGYPANTCKRMRGCADLYPIVVCPLTGASHGPHEGEANAGFSTFIRLFSTPPLVAP